MEEYFYDQLNYVQSAQTYRIEIRTLDGDAKSGMISPGSTKQFFKISLGRETYELPYNKPFQALQLICKHLLNHCEKLIMITHKDDEFVKRKEFECNCSGREPPFPEMLGELMVGLHVVVRRLSGSGVMKLTFLKERESEPDYGFVEYEAEDLDTKVIYTVKVFDRSNVHPDKDPNVKRFIDMTDYLHEGYILGVKQYLNCDVVVVPHEGLNILEYCWRHGLNIPLLYKICVDILGELVQLEKLQVCHGFGIEINDIVSVFENGTVKFRLRNHVFACGYGTSKAPHKCPAEQNLSARNDLKWLGHAIEELISKISDDGDYEQWWIENQPPQGTTWWRVGKRIYKLVNTLINLDMQINATTALDIINLKYLHSFGG